MNVQEFQAKLGEICKLAEEKGNQLDAAEIREFFKGMDLDQSQLLKVVQYLKMKGVAIQGIEAAAPAEEEAEEEDKTVPLTPEEAEYVKGYLDTLPAAPVSEKSVEELFSASP